MNSLRTDAEAFAIQRLTWSMSWPQLLSAMWPMADSPRSNYWGHDQWFLLNQFLGTLPCALALLGAFAGPRRARALAVGALLLALLSLGKHFPPATWALQLPPFSLFRYPVKYFVGAAFFVGAVFFVTEALPGPFFFVPGFVSSNSSSISTPTDSANDCQSKPRSPA